MERISVAIIGPTGSGKSRLAVLLAKELNGEIISADSRQVYLELTAGTAKPQRDLEGKVEGIPYHLVDFIDPISFFDAGSFADIARALINEIKGRRHLPIVTGGTGLYLKALMGGLAPVPKGDPAVRALLMTQSEKKGRAALHQELLKIDPVAASKIPPNNIQRVVRALEVFNVSGRPISDYWNENPSPHQSDFISLLIEWPLETFKLKIKERCEEMWPKIIEETSRLIPRFYSGKEPGFKSLGYPLAIQCVRGEISIEEGLLKFIQETLAYAKRQRTWFRHQLKGPVFQIAGGAEEIMLARALEVLSKI